MRKTSARSLAIRAAAWVAALAINPAAHSEPYPSRPVTLVSPLAAGTSVEAVTRAWMQCVSQPKRAGQPFILVNKPGANGVIAAAHMRQQPNDGYTLLVGGMSQTTITPFLFRKQPYDAEKEYRGAAMFAHSSLTLVTGADSGIKNVNDLVAYAKSRRGGVDIGIPAIGTPAHLLGAALAGKLGIPYTIVPMAGEAGGVTAILGNQVPLMIFLTGSIAQHIDSGRAVALMNFTESRLPSMPQVPTASELLRDPSMARMIWIGITTLAGGPPEVVSSIERWTKECMDSPEFLQGLKSAYFTPQYYGTQDYAVVVRRDIEFWHPWIDRLGIKND